MSSQKKGRAAPASLSIMADFRKSLEIMVARMYKRALSVIERGGVDVDDIIPEMNKKKAKKLSDKMAQKTLRQATFALNNSFEKGILDISIRRDKMSKRTKENISSASARAFDMIVSLYDGERDRIKRSIMESEDKGLSVGQVKSSLSKSRGISMRRAKNVAYDQARKTHSFLMESRMRDAGIKKFQWVHSGGGKRPRNLHKNFLDGKIFSIDNPPIIDRGTGERGIPGQAINCRCRMVPIFEDTKK